jgi:hypothetical protein
MLAISNPFCLQFRLLLGLVGVIAGILAAIVVILIAAICRLLLAWMPLHVPCSCVLGLAWLVFYGSMFPLVLLCWEFVPSFILVYLVHVFELACYLAWLLLILIHTYILIKKNATVSH